MVDTMTSWFSVSDALTRVAVMVCVVCVTGGQLGAVQGTLRIPQCSAQGWLEALEESTPYVSCEGFSAKQIVKWKIIRNNIVVVNSTCRSDPATPNFQTCSRTSSDIEVVRFTNKPSELYIMDNLRELVSNGRVDCYVPNNTAAATCRTNVISHAVLSDCEVTMTTHRTLAGTCNFNNAYSSNGTYTCTWTLTPTDKQGSPDVIIPGNITKCEQISDGKLYYRGTCSFTRQIPGGHYNYTVRFFPEKPGHQYQESVNIPVPSATTESTSPTSAPAVLSGCELTMTTQRELTGTCNFNNAYSSNGTYTCTWTLTPMDGKGDLEVIIRSAIHKSQHSVSGTLYYRGTCSFTSSWLPPGHYSYIVRFFPGGQSQGTETVTVTAADQSSSTDAYIAGGVVAAVVVIVAVVVVVVLVRRYLGRRLYDRPRRRKRRQPEEHPYNGLNVYQTVGQPAPSTSHVQGTAQSVYEIPDQESAPGVELSQTNTAFTPDTDDRKLASIASQPYENQSPPGSHHPMKNGCQPGSSSQTKENNCSPNSSHPYENDSPLE